METKLTIRLDRELHRKFKVKLTERGDTAQAVLLAMVEAYLKQKGA